MTHDGEFMQTRLSIEQNDAKRRRNQAMKESRVRHAYLLSVNEMPLYGVSHPQIL